MFNKPESESDYDNEKIEYRIVTSYDEAYKYNSPKGYEAPKAESFVDINEKNYRLESTKRERTEKNIKNNDKNSRDKYKFTWETIGDVIGEIVSSIVESIF